MELHLPCINPSTWCYLFRNNAKFVTCVQIENIWSLIEKLASYRLGGKPLSKSITAWFYDTLVTRNVFNNHYKILTIWSLKIIYIFSYHCHLSDTLFLWYFCFVLFCFVFTNSHLSHPESSDAETSYQNGRMAFSRSDAVAELAPEGSHLSLLNGPAAESTRVDHETTMDVDDETVISSCPECPSGGHHRKWSHTTGYCWSCRGGRDDIPTDRWCHASQEYAACDSWWIYLQQEVPGEKVASWQDNLEA